MLQNNSFDGYFIEYFFGVGILPIKLERICKRSQKEAIHLGSGWSKEKEIDGKGKMEKKKKKEIILLFGMDKGI